MSTQSPGKQPVTIGIMDHVSFSYPGHGQGPAHDGCPHLNILSRVADNRGFTGSARGSMYPHNLIHGYGEQPKRVIIPQIVLGGKGQMAQVGQTLDITRLDPGLIHFCLIRCHGFIHPVHQFLQPFQLD